MCTLYTRDAGQTRGVLSHAPGLDAGDLIMQPNHSARGMQGTPTDPLALAPLASQADRQCRESCD